MNYRPSPREVFGELALGPQDVSLIYRLLLGRDAADEEAAAQLRATGDWRALLTAVATSHEYEARLATPRVPPAAVVNTWHPDLASFGHRVGTMSLDGEAVIGHEGWVFLVRGSNAVLEQYSPQFELPDGWRRLWAEALGRRRDDAARLGCAIAMLVVPDKVSVLGAHLPDDLRVTGTSPASRLAAEEGLLYPVDLLADAPRPAFLRNDTHLSLAGNEVLARAVAESLGIVPGGELPQAGVRYPAFGDLGARFSPPVAEVVDVVGSMGAATVVEDNHEAIARVGRHLGTRTVLRNPSAPHEGTLVVFGDSFAVAAPHYQGLAWFLAQWVTEVHFCWTPFGWDPDYLESVGATAVLLETAERFVPRPPAPSVDVRALEHAVTGASA